MAFRSAASIRNALKRLVSTLGLSPRAISVALPFLISAVSNAASPDPLAVEFGTMPALWGVGISPDGSKASLLQMHPDDFPILTIMDLTTGKANLALASTKDGFDIQWCRWANNERLLCSYYAITGGWQLYGVTRLVAVNADGSGMRVLLEHKKQMRSAQFHDNITDYLPDDPKRILMTMPTDKGVVLKALDIYSGGTEGPTEKLLGYGEWVSDGRGVVRLFLYISDDNVRWRYRRSGEMKWRELHERKMANFDEDFYPQGFGEDPDDLLVLKPHEGRLALWSVDLKGEKEDELIYSHPEVDLNGTLQLGKYHRIVAIGYSTDRNALHFFDAAVKKISDRLSAVFPDKMINVFDESWDRRYYGVYVGSDLDPGTFYRFDVQKNQLLRIYPQYPLLGSRLLAPMKSVRYRARDGNEIPAYLTLPPGVEGPYPTVILPHGGPESRDYWGFDWLVQFIAAKGYAVLQSNYRGSGGYGSEWTGTGGFRNWRTAISDITDGAQYLVDQGIADPKRVCIVGWSYGGYAALLSAAEEPSRYRCVVSIAGVSDLEMMLNDSRYFLNRKAVRKQIGRDSDVIGAGSPVNRASEIEAPVLLFHGDRDINVPVDHSKKMARALKSKKKSVEYIEYEDVEHSIRRNAYRIDMLDRIGSFLDANIGQPAAAP